MKTISKQEPSFEEAMNFTLLWCTAWEKGELSDEVLADRIAQLIETKDGARGFLVITLASDCPLMDRLPEPVIFKLWEGEELIIDLIVRNLAMSTAMSLHHKRTQNSDQEDGSKRVSARCTDLLRLLDPNSVKSRIEEMLKGIQGKGNDAVFLEKWNYDKEQKEAIKSRITSVADK